MSQFPFWDRQFAVWSNAAQLRQGQLRDIASDLTARGQETLSEVRAQTFEYIEHTRRRIEELPQTLADELRRRMNVLDLATKHDVEAQSKLERRRVAAVAKEIREAHGNHDEHLLRTLRAQLREELEIFAAAIADDLFSLDEPPPATTRRTTDDDDIELVSLDDLDGTETRRASYDTPDG